MTPEQVRLLARTDPQMQRMVRATVRTMLRRLLDREEMEERGSRSKDDPFASMISFEEATASTGMPLKNIERAVSDGYAEGSMEHRLVEKASLLNHLSERIAPQQLSGRPPKVAPEGSITYAVAAEMMELSMHKFRLLLSEGVLKRKAPGYVMKADVEILLDQERLSGPLDPGAEATRFSIRPYQERPLPPRVINEMFGMGPEWVQGLIKEKKVRAAGGNVFPSDVRAFVSTKPLPPREDGKPGGEGATESGVVDNGAVQTDTPEA